MKAPEDMNAADDAGPNTDSSVEGKQKVLSPTSPADDVENRQQRARIIRSQSHESLVAGLSHQSAVRMSAAETDEVHKDAAEKAATENKAAAEKEAAAVENTASAVENKAESEDHAASKESPRCYRREVSPQAGNNDWLTGKLKELAADDKEAGEKAEEEQHAATAKAGAKLLREQSIFDNDPSRHQATTTTTTAANATMQLRNQAQCDDDAAEKAAAEKKAPECTNATEDFLSHEDADDAGPKTDSVEEKKEDPAPTSLADEPLEDVSQLPPQRKRRKKSASEGGKHKKKKKRHRDGTDKEEQGAAPPAAKQQPQDRPLEAAARAAHHSAPSGPPSSISESDEYYKKMIRDRERSLDASDCWSSADEVERRDAATKKPAPIAQKAAVAEEEEEEDATAQMTDEVLAREMMDAQKKLAKEEEMNQILKELEGEDPRPRDSSHKKKKERRRCRSRSETERKEMEMDLRRLQGSKELDAEQQTIAAEWIDKSRHHDITVAWNMAMRRVTRKEFKKQLHAAQKEGKAKLSSREFMRVAFGAGEADWKDRAAAALALQVDERQKEEAPRSSLAKDIVENAADGDDDDGDAEVDQVSGEAPNDEDEDAAHTNMEGPKVQAQIRARDKEAAQELVAQLGKQLERAKRLAASS